MKKSKTFKALLIERKPNDEGEGIEAKNRLLFSLIDIKQNESLTQYYEALKCDTIDIQERYINGVLYDFIIDDEYLLNGKSREPSNCIALGNRKGDILEAIYGGLIICGTADKDGEETSLKDEDIKNILSHGIAWAHNNINGESYEIIKYNFEAEK